MFRCSLNSTWDNYLDLLPSTKQDIYFAEAYLNLYKDDGISECFICQEDENIWLFPYIKKQIIYKNNIYWDFESPYGYGGPISNCDNNGFLRQAQNEFYSFLKNNGFIAGLIRFHPLLNNHILLQNCATLFFNRYTVGVNLLLDIKKIWQEQMHSKLRNSIRNAQKAGFTFLVDTTFRFYDEFKNLYIETMKKNHAAEFYFFNNEYFELVKESFLGNSFLGHVLHGKEIISSAIFLYSNDYSHYHLSGNNSDYLHMNPNSFLLFKSIEYFKSINKKIFHLGGGADSSIDNTLYRFKGRFSKQRYDFYMGEIIFNQSIYDSICMDWAEVNPEKVTRCQNRILKYRY